MQYRSAIGESTEIDLSTSYDISEDKYSEIAKLFKLSVEELRISSSLEDAVISKLSVKDS